MSGVSFSVSQPIQPTTLRADHGVAETRGWPGSASHGAGASASYSVAHAGTGPASHAGPYNPAAAPAHPDPIIAHCPEEGLTLTTLAIGEEDGGAGMDFAPGCGGADGGTHSSDMNITTLALGEEDGGGSYASLGEGARYHTQTASATYTAPSSDYAYQSHSGGYAVSAYGVETQGYHGGGGLRPGYGTMQPIYSPGELEYSDYARGSTTPELLNHTYIQPNPAPDPMPVYAQPAPQAYVSTGHSGGGSAYQAPSTMAPAPGGNYVSVGDYDAYVSGGQSSYQAPAPTYEAPVQAYEAPAHGSGHGAGPIYDPQPAPVYDPQPAPVHDPQPAPIYDPAGGATDYQSGPIYDPAPAYDTGYDQSAEPMYSEDGEDLMVTTLALGEEDGGGGAY